MSFFDQESKSSSKTSNTLSPDDALKLALSAVVILSLLALVKFWPVVFIGAILGLIVHQGATDYQGLARIKRLGSGTWFFATLDFFWVGFPSLIGGNPKNFGMLFHSELLVGYFNYFVSYWNHFFKGAFFKFARFDVKHMTDQGVTDYFWGAIGISLLATLVAEILRVRARKKEQRFERSQEPGAWVKICSLPVRIVRWFFDLLLTRWMARGRMHIQMLRSDKRALIRGILGVVSLGFTALLMSAYLFPKLLGSPLDEIVSYLSFLPAIGIVLGMGLEISEFFVRELGLSDLFRKKGQEFHLGKDFNGKSYPLTEQNLSYHVEIIAPTGSGKTNLLKNLIADRIQRGHGLIFLDLKAEFQVVEWMMRVARSCGREEELRLVSLANRELSVPYNPIGSGTAPEIHSQLMNGWTWSEEYYRNVSGMALMTLLRGLCEYRDKTGENFHLGHLYTLLNEPGILRAWNEKLTQKGCQASREVELLAEKLDRPSERDKLTGLVANLGLLIHSAAGPLVSEDVSQGHSFDFKEAIDEGKITYVLMNSLKLRETASVFGKLILQDLMKFAGDRYAELGGEPHHHRPVTLIIDEFAAFAIPEFIEFMDRARGAGIGIVFAHQARADLKSISPEFQERIEANSNTVIVSGVKSSLDAEYYAGMLGTQGVVKETVQIEEGWLGPMGTGMKSLRDAEEYVIHPNRIKDLQQGEVLTISRTVDTRWGILKVPRAHEFLENGLAPSETLNQLKMIRKTYLTGQKERYLDLKTPQNAPGLTRAPQNELKKDQNDVSLASPPAQPDLWS